MITVTFHCGGCDAKAEGTAPLREKFYGLNGRPYGFGNYIWDTPEEVKPEGWTASDIIGATYCPGCTKSLVQDTLTEQAVPARRKP